MVTNEAKKRELDELIEEERRTFLTIEPEEPRDSGGASGSGGPAGSTPGPMAAAVHKDPGKPLMGGVKIPTRNTTHVSVRIPTGDGSWGVRYFVKGKTGRKPSIVNYKPLVQVAPEDSDPLLWRPLINI